MNFFLVMEYGCVTMSTWSFLPELLKLLSGSTAVKTQRSGRSRPGIEHVVDAFVHYSQSSKFIVFAQGGNALCRSPCPLLWSCQISAL